MNFSAYLLGRLIATGLFGVLLFWFLKRMKRLKILELLAAVSVFFAVSALIPAENLFRSFDNPVSALNYQLAKSGADVIKTDDFAVVLYKKNEKAYGVFKAPKKGDAYKLPSMFGNSGNLVELSTFEYPDLSVYTCRVGNSDKAILLIIEYAADEADDRYNFADSQENAFIKLPKRLVGELPEQTIVAIHYAEIDAKDKLYTLFINESEAASGIKIK